jgi:hypothetical protein
MTHICELCGRNASQENSFVCSECDASHTTQYDYDPTPEDESEVVASPKGTGDHTPECTN